MPATDMELARVLHPGASDERSRTKARRLLRTRAPHISHLAAVIVMCSRGRDPGDGLEFVRRLHLVCGAILRSASNLHLHR